MAKIKVGNAMPEWGWFDDFYDEATFKLDSQSSGKAVYEDKNGFDIVLSGKGLSYSGKNIMAGTVKSVEFLDDHGKTLIAVTEGNFNGHKLSDALLKHGDLWDFMTLLTAGNDRISGNNVGCDLNFGENHGNDIMVAGSGGSSLGGSRGNDILKGGANWDDITFADTFWRNDDKHGIKLDAVKGTILDSWGDKDTFDKKFEQFDGSVYKDEMKGSNRDEAFSGLKGNDIIDGGGGWDTVRYHRDEHYNGKHGIVANLATGKITDGFGDVDAVKNIEAVYGTYKNDKLIGDSHDNEFRGVSGVDSFDGGRGTDQVNLDWWEDLGQHGAKVDLSKTKGQIIDDGFGNIETTKSIEAVSGTVFGDSLKLGKSNGWAWGNDGDDTLIAGIGTQWFGGGAGADTFVFETAKTMSTGKELDYIDDFFAGEGDKVDLHSIAALEFVGTAKFTGGDELRYKVDGDHTLVYGDTNGDKKADFAIDFSGKIAFTADDFIL